MENWHEKTVEEYLALVARHDHEEYRALWFEIWMERLNFVLTVPNVLPAVPHGGMKKGYKTCSYIFLFNLVLSLFTSGILTYEPFTSLITPRVLCQSLTWIGLWMRNRQYSRLTMPSRQVRMKCMMPTSCMVSPSACKSLDSDSKRRRYLRE